MTEVIESTFEGTGGGCRYSVSSIYTNRGIGRARKARQELGFDLVSPLPDLLEAIERPGGAVVILDMGSQVAGAYLRCPSCPLLFVNGRDAVTRQLRELAITGSVTATSSTSLPTSTDTTPTR